MSEPTLSLKGLSIWVQGRAFPYASDYWDGNWLVVRATMEARGASITAEGPFLMTADFREFRNELEAMDHALAGEASLSGLEPNLKVALVMNRLGHISGEVHITPDPMGQFHRFDVALDQSDLPALIQACDSILERFPVTGESRA